MRDAHAAAALCSRVATWSTITAATGRRVNIVSVSEEDPLSCKCPDKLYTVRMAKTLSRTKKTTSRAQVELASLPLGLGLNCGEVSVIL
jgi:hypothetical protein